MTEEQMERKPGFMPVTSEVSFIADSLNKKLQANPQLYRTALESGRLVTDKVQSYYVPRDGEEEAIDTINEFITSDYSRYLEFDEETGDLFYEAPDKKELLNQYKRSEGKRQETLRLEMKAVRIGFVIDRLIDYEAKHQPRKQRAMAKAG